MRKIIVSEFVSLDGVMQGPGPDDSFEYAGWTMPYINEQFMAYKLSELVASEALLLGRITYEGFAKTWPGRQDKEGFADKMNSMQKYVVSTTLTTATWNNTTIISDDVVAKILALRQSDGGDILVNGSAQLVDTLMENNLVDELRLLVYPVVVGKGKKLFGGNTHTLLKLVSSEVYDTGVALLTYQPAHA
jgi:dihydrofolate reductase